ncbi:MAG TPA: carbamoyltransferase HypF, partial [Firmicutes bacterium]|nr:carbamoyltransferase HypF [Bacillota bacterium]
MKRFKIKITGIVQGVGFRPFIYNLASAKSLTGFVLNNSEGVDIEIQGPENLLKEFLTEVPYKKPVISLIRELTHTEINVIKKESEFIIKSSKNLPGKFVLISPDLALCQDCLKELFTLSDRRFKYPFINCTNCGPRFTIIKDVPYDREKTTMSEFEMCSKCRTEYNAPSVRRFHAQPNACHDCGPSLSLKDSEGRSISADDIIEKAVDLLQKGKIIAIKGLGGFHLACDAQNEEAVFTLRKRKIREDKPFAVMVPNPDIAEKLVDLTENDIRILKDITSPILIKRKKEDSGIAESVAPNNKDLGIMLPYTPLHHLICKTFGKPLVMTSGNKSDEPIAFHDTEAISRLSGIADYFLIHNREIYMRCDDSVVREVNGHIYLLRRARGFVPFPVFLPKKSSCSILACGGMLKNTFCLTRDNLAFISHHIGDLENLETLNSFEEGIEHFKKLFSISPRVIVYDLHPEYLSTKYALDSKIEKKLGIQHHFAHILSCMSDNNLPNKKVIGVACDGTGYGEDGKIWGGEILIADYEGYERFAHLDYFPLPGGDSAVINPYKSAISLLIRAGVEEDIILNKIFPGYKEEYFIIKKMIETGFNTVDTSSLGRLFDGVSSILGIRNIINYEGQAAIELEQVSDPEINLSFSGNYFNKERRVLEYINLIKNVVKAKLEEKPTSEIGGVFHNSLVEMFISGISSAGEEFGINEVVLSGGVFQN